MMRARAVSFDFGETIATIDTGLLSRKLERVGLRAPEERIDARVALAWSAYDAAIADGQGGHPWKFFMRALLEASAEPTSATAPFEELVVRAVDWLWSEQPKENLWRKPIPGMLELCRELRDRGVPYGVLSNSEGRLVELIEEMGQTELFTIVADSGRLGIEKPDARIFRWLSNAIGASPESVVHIGDSLGADVEGAIAADMSAIWFSPHAGGGRADVSKLKQPDRVSICRDADEVRDALVRFGIPL